MNRFQNYIPQHVGFNNVKHVVSVSGGKDSGATYLEALEQTEGDFIALCADTGREVRAVSRLQVSTFFHQGTTPGATGPTSIDEVVRWSRTLHGGKRFDPLAYTSPPTSDVCIYAGGLCE